MSKNINSNYISNYISIIFVYFTRMLIPFLIIILIGRFYSPEEFGRYAVATSFMGVLGLFLIFGTSNVTSFEIASLRKGEEELQKKIAEILKTCIIILLIFSVIGLFLMSIILSFINYNKEITKIIIALFFGYFFMAFNSVMCAVFIGIKEMKWIIPSNIANLISVVIIVLPFIYLKKPLYLIALLWSLSQFVGIIVTTYLLKKNGFLVDSKITKSKIYRLIKRSIGVGLDNVIYKLGVNLTNIILPFYLAEVQIGIFNGAFKPFVLLIAGNQITIQFFIPYLASRRNEGKQEKERILHIFHKLNVLFTCTIIIMPLFFSNFLNRFFFGNKLTESIPYMVLMTLGYFIYYLPPYAVPLKAFGKEWKVIYSSLGQLMINLFAIIILVPKYGVKGAVYAVIMAFLAYWLINILIYIKEKIRPISNIFNYFLFIVFSLLNGFLIQTFLYQNIYSIFLFIIINFIVAYLIFFTKKDKRLFISFLKVKHQDILIKS